MKKIQQSYNLFFNIFWNLLVDLELSIMNICIMQHISNTSVQTSAGAYKHSQQTIVLLNI